MKPARAAWITGAVIFGLIALLVTAGIGDSAEGGNRIGQMISAIAILGAPQAVAAAVVAGRVASVARGRDLAERLLELATTGGHGMSDDWGRAMRAELAIIDSPRERRRFAIGCLLTPLRVGTGRGLWLIALGTGAALSLATFAISRVTLAGGRGGIMEFTLLGPILVLFIVAFVATLATRSFRTGVVLGGIAMLAALIGVLGVATAEAGWWYEVAGVYIMDGDSPKVALDRLGAMFDPVSPVFVLFHLLIWVPWPVLGAAAASLSVHRLEDQARPAATADV